MQQGSQVIPLQQIPGHGPLGQPNGGQETLHISGSGFLLNEFHLKRFD